MNTINLSSRASRYVQALERKKSWLITPSVASYYLRKQGINHTSELVSFQENYSGIVLTIRNHAGETFNANLFSSFDILFNRDSEPLLVKNKYILECGEHATAQFNFYIADTGHICTYEGDALNILYSSFSKMVEDYALRDELVTWKESPYYYEILDDNLLEEYVDQGYWLMEECVDEYNKWWTNGKSILHKGVWLDRPEFYLHVYATTTTWCEALIESLTTAGIIHGIHI